MKKYVINLERSKDRLDMFIKMNKKHIGDVNVFKAVDGKELNIEKQGDDMYKIKLNKYECHLSSWKSKRIHNKGLMTNGEFGCAITHMLLYKQLLNDKECDCYMILEDDVYCLVNENMFKEYMDDLPNDFDLIQLSTSQWYPYSQYYQSVNKHYSNIYKRYFNGTMSYIISKKGAQKIIDHTLVEINNTADDVLSSSFLRKENSLNIIVPIKPLFDIDVKQKSTIHSN